MKTLFFSTLFLVSFYFSNAQHYFPSDSVRWRMMHERMDAGNITRKMQDISFTDDTIIRSGLVFRKILEQYTWSFRLTRGPFLHIDSVVNKVLFLRTASDTIINLYDFSLTVGDSMTTLQGSEPTGGMTWHVIEDSTLIVNSEQRRYLKVERRSGVFSYEDIWIEGIGSVRGLYAPIFEIPYSFEFGFHLACFTDSTTAVQYQPLDFFTQFYYDCNSVFSVEENTISNYIKAYPNPASETLVLENLYEESLEYVIYSMDGKKVEKLKLSPQSSSVVNIKNWPSGMYSLLVSNAKGELVFNTKIIR